MTILPELFKKTSVGAYQRWLISVDGATIITEHGQVGGKQQTTRDTIAEGKNLGKANATTAEQQALAEATAKHQKQLKKGYVDSLEKAQAGELDEVIEGGIAPMLAPSELYPKHAAKLSWPVYVQPKLDGQRLIAIVENGVCTLWSRTRKPVRSLPHIAEAMSRIFPTGRHVVDGEAYADQFSEDFEALMSIVRKDYVDPEGRHLRVQYWVYDYPSVEGNFSRRSDKLHSVVGLAAESSIVLVSTIQADNDAQVRVADETNVEAGYEGTMIRNDGPYEGGRRSYHLQKLKAMVDGEWPIIGVEEGRGKDAGTVGAFVCRAKNGEDFRCRLKASYARRRELFQHPEQWHGMLLTVKYQKMSAYDLPIFPIGKGLRKSEE